MMSSAVESTALLATGVRPLESQRLEIKIKGDQAVIVDLSALVARRDIYWRLRQDRYFRMVKVDEQGVLCWPEGEDIAPESLGRYVVRENM